MVAGAPVTPRWASRIGADIYAEDGLSTTINKGASVDAFRTLTDLYRVYGARQDFADIFNSFRYGEVPVIVGDVDVYFRLMLYAPELIGKWDIALIPGVRQPDGSIKRDYPSADRACMIFDNTLHPQEAYDYLHWWLSADTQVKFAYSARAVWGPEYYWIPGNIKALRQMYFPPEHMNIILEQRSWEREPFRHVAWYMLERTLSDAYIDVVKEGKNPLVMLNRAALETDREIIRKLIEFGYLDEQGNVIREYQTDTVEQLKRETGAR
jgi:ABC-type glycerol-3-phosphate transport system substrate-binding protein